MAWFAEAGRRLENPRYGEFAGDIIEFVDNYTHLPDGGFAAAIDADHGGVEGGYYLWNHKDLPDLPASLHRAAVETGSVFLYRAVSGSADQSWRKRLKQRRQTPRQRVDNRITEWNALWITALLEAGNICQAIDLAKTIWGGAWDGGRLVRLGDQPGYLDDYAWLSSAFWQLYIATADSAWKGRAGMLDRRILELFYRDGQFSYAPAGSANDFAIDLYLDRELPSPLAAGHYQRYDR